MKKYRTRFSAAAVAVLLFGLVVVTGTGQGADAPEGASIVGVVKFDGEPPEREPISMVANKPASGNREECSELHETPLLSEDVLVSDEGGLANVFIYIRRGLEKKDYPVPEEPVVVNQQMCMFSPRVQGVRVGQKLVLRNSDPMTHNVRAYALRNRAFNIAQPAKTADRERVFKRPEAAIQIGCDFHRWMEAYVFAMDHPFFAVSNEKGEFEIAGLPAGTYNVEAWHEEFGKQRADITVGPSGSVEMNFAFEAKD